MRIAKVGRCGEVTARRAGRAGEGGIKRQSDAPTKGEWMSRARSRKRRGRW